jgi:hypothetical protein
MTAEQRVEWEAEVRSLYDGMVRIVMTRTWAKLIDFESGWRDAVVWTIKSCLGRIPTAAARSGSSVNALNLRDAQEPGRCGSGVRRGSRHRQRTMGESGSTCLNVVAPTPRSPRRWCATAKRLGWAE